MKCCLGISNFLEEISSLSHSAIFLYFFALITEEVFLIFPGYSLELYIQMGIFPFLLCFLLLFFSQLFVRPPQTTIVDHQFSSVQSLSRVWLFATPWIAARQASLSTTNSQSLLKHMSIESVMPSSHLILRCPLLLLLPNPSQHQGLFQWVKSSHEVAKVLEFQPQHQSLETIKW